VRREYFRLAEFRTDQVACVGLAWCGPPEQCLAVAQALLKQAKKGSISHVQEAANRLEGRVESSDESAGGVTFNVIISAPTPHRPAIGDGSGHDEHCRR